MIGIVTPYKISNYGTKLQAYAMQQVMGKYDDSEILGFVPSTDYRMHAVIGKIYLKISRCFRKNNKRMETELMKKRTVAIHSFDKYYRFGRKIEGNASLKKYIGNYNLIVCGSDQLWAPSNVIADYFTLTLIPSNVRKISYAASFGVSSVPFYLKSRYRKFLSEFDQIAVREDQGRHIVMDLSGREAEVVLDPTLMLKREEWENLCQDGEIKVESPYIFCYFLGVDEKHRTFAKSLAKQKKINLVTIPHFKEWNAADENFGDEQIYEAGPVEFLNLIKNAEYVCTDSFHGTVFSILFNKQVAIFERFSNNSVESTNSRIYTLLDSLGLSQHIFHDESEVGKFVSQRIDYEIVGDKLDQLRKKSYQYLENAINNKGQD